MHRSPIALFSFVAAALVTTAAPPGARAQSLARRVAAAPDGPVTFRFAARSGVCGDGHTFIALGNSMFTGSSVVTTTGDAEWRDVCRPGPVRVVLTVRDGRVEHVRRYAGSPSPLGGEGGTDLGLVTAKDAASYLLDLAEHADAPASEQAILPAVLADSAVVWPQLLRLAHDDATRSHSTRRTATFWLGRFAAATLTGRTITNLGADDERDTDEGVRASAVFALSQLRHHKGIPPLIQVARSNPNPRLRAHAVFWLSQSDDPRALEFLGEVLKKAGQ
jgi:hypothetical protein